MRLVNSDRDVIRICNEDNDDEFANRNRRRIIGYRHARFRGCTFRQQCAARRHDQ